MDRRALTLAIPVVCALLFACADAEPPPDSSAVDWTPLVVDSVVRIGGSEARGPAAFGRVRDVALGADPARVAIADWQSQEIRAFGLDGRYERTFGRQGEGPGEYDALTAIGVRTPGQVVGWDTDLRRLTVHGDRADSVIPTDFRAFPDRSPVFLGPSADGSFVFVLPVSVSTLQGRQNGTFQDTVPFVRLDPTGRLVDTIARIAAPQEHFFDEGSIWGLEADVFGPSLLRTALPAGIAIVRGAAPVVELIEGARHSSYRVPLDNRMPTPELVRSERDRRLDAMRPILVDGIDVRGSQRDVVESVGVADTLPAFDALVGGQDGSLWFRRYALASDSLATWLRVVERRPAGSLRLPVNEKVVAADGGLVATLATDELGAAVVRLLWIDQ